MPSPIHWMRGANVLVFFMCLLIGTRSGVAQGKWLCRQCIPALCQQPRSQVTWSKQLRGVCTGVFRVGSKLRLARPPPVRQPPQRRPPGAAASPPLVGHSPTDPQSPVPAATNPSPPVGLPPPAPPSPAPPVVYRNGGRDLGWEVLDFRVGWRAYIPRALTAARGRRGVRGSNQVVHCLALPYVCRPPPAPAPNTHHRPDPAHRSGPDLRPRRQLHTRVRPGLRPRGRAHRRPQRQQLPVRPADMAPLRSPLPPLQLCAHDLDRPALHHPLHWRRGVVD